MISIDIGGDKLNLDQTEDGLKIVSFTGDPVVFKLPGRVNVSGEDLSITSIEKKAFLGKKSLKEVYIPSTVKEISDWAFSQCSHLKRVYIEASSGTTFGKSVFEGCNKLTDIFIKDMPEGVSALIASCTNRFPGAFLLRDSDIGSEAWLLRYDLTLLSYLNADDHEGYNGNVPSGEEDISLDDIGSVDGEMPGAKKGYLSEVKKNKCFLSLLRLSHDLFLNEERKEKLEVYIRSRAFGSKDPSAWLMIKDLAADDMDKLKLYLDIVAPGKEELNGMIADLSEAHAEARAFLIGISREKKSDDFFSDLLL